jgi:cytoplasmic iron level regulating protein YaaA (DUF328/UPF0246 family)
MPYRLEMGTKLKNSRGNNLYGFGRANQINQDLAEIDAKLLVNFNDLI